MTGVQTCALPIYRVRDQVIKIIRTAEMSDLTDPGSSLPVYYGVVWVLRVK